jgi:type I restriction enzyme S subunit
MMAMLSEIAKLSNGKKKGDVTGVVPVYGGNGVFDYTDIPNSNNCVIIGRVGAYCGSVHYEPSVCWVSDNAIRCEAKPGADIRYLFYLLKSLKLDRRQIGTSQPLLTQGILNAIELDSIPSLDLQQAIASMLWSFDEKISLNKRTNDYLAA